MPDKKKRHEVAAKIESAIKQVRIIPAGSNDPLPPVPDVVDLDESDLEAISRLWDELMPEYAGMLDAEVIREQYNDNPNA